MCSIASESQLPAKAQGRNSRFNAPCGSINSANAAAIAAGECTPCLGSPSEPTYASTSRGFIWNSNGPSGIDVGNFEIVSDITTHGAAETVSKSLKRLR